MPSRGPYGDAVTNPWELPSLLEKRQADREAANTGVKYGVRGRYERPEGHSGTRVVDREGSPLR